MKNTIFHTKNCENQHVLTKEDDNLQQSWCGRTLWWKVMEQAREWRMIIDWSHKICYAGIMVQKSSEIQIFEKKIISKKIMTVDEGFRLKLEFYIVSRELIYSYKELLFKKRIKKRKVVEFFFFSNSFVLLLFLQNCIIISVIIVVN